jgi:hypothetical protein
MAAMPAFLRPNGLHALNAALCAAITAAGCAAQELVPLATAPTPTYAVHGVVENSITRQPIARALVEDRQDGVLTNSEGRFELNLPQGFNQIRARRPGYSEGRDDWHMLQVGAETPELTLELTPSATITGHVTLSGGDAADGIRISVYRRQVFNGHASWQAEGSTETDGEGVFRFLQLDAPGAFIVCSTPTRERGGAATRAAPVFGYPTACFAGNSDFASASPMPIAAGQQAEVEISLARQRFYPVTIGVSNRVPGSGVGFELRDRGGQPLNFGVRWNEQRGTLEAELPNGSYSAEARSFAGNTQLYGRADFKVADAPTQGLNIALAPLPTVAVEIHKEIVPVKDARQGETLTLASEDTGPGLNLNLTPADPSAEGQSGGNIHRPRGSTDTSGSRDSGLFIMEVPRPGRYWVEATPFQGYVSSITSGGVDLAREPLVVGPGGTSAPIEIILRNDSGELECTVNSAPAAAEGASFAGMVPSVYVYAIPMFPSAARIPEITVTEGATTLPNLAPGTYRVAAFDRRREIDLDDAQEMARLTSKGTTVHVEPGLTAHLQLDIVKTGEEEASR